jgi:NAD(P)H-hydrate repair Nnr-like enzyme with NAD(P)H-hydrate dehydratase domain
MKRQSVPTILDAGALYLAGKLNQPTLITPHAGELARLFALHSITVSSESIEADPATWASKAAHLLDVTVLLKGSRTVVAHMDRVISLPQATPFLATAGSGDVLAGIIGALVATNYIEILNSQERLAEVAATGAYIHNQAALLASLGAPISASMIVEYITPAIRKILK